MSKFNVNFNIWYPSSIEKLAAAVAIKYRKIRYGYGFRLIKLSKGKCATVDAEDFEGLNKHKWYIKEGGTDTFYAVRKKGGVIVYMHRQLMPVPKGLYVDHINRDGLDNRKANLRAATHSQNCRNRRKMRGNYSSRYKGVHWSEELKKWRANIRIDRKAIHLGYFTDEIEAGRAYDAAAKLRHGKYASLNFEEEATMNMHR